MKVFKYPIVEGTFYFGSFYVGIETGAKILSVGLQGDTLVVWALVNPNNVRVVKEFIVVPSGHTTINFAEMLTFVGTVQYDSGIVAHVFVNNL